MRGKGLEQIKIKEITAGKSLDNALAELKKIWN